MSHDNKKTKVHRFYVPEEYEPTIQTLKTVLQREGSNLSKWIRENGERYVRLHEPGNPQQRLDVILKLGRPYRAPGPKCGMKGCSEEGVTMGLFLPSKKTFNLCSSHVKEARQSLNWRILSDVLTQEEEDNEHD